jgi:hypothetical protein
VREGRRRGSCRLDRRGGTSEGDVIAEGIFVLLFGFFHEVDDCSGQSAITSGKHELILCAKFAKPRKGFQDVFLINIDDLFIGQFDGDDPLALDISPILEQTLLDVPQLPRFDQQGQIVALFVLVYAEAVLEVVAGEELLDLG